MPLRVVLAPGVPESPARTRAPERPPLRIAAVQHRWHRDPPEHEAALAEGIASAAEHGAELVCLQELTLSAYFAAVPGGPAPGGVSPEPLTGGPTYRFAAAAAARHGLFVHASLFEADAAVAPLGYNTAICVAPDGALVAHTRKVHIPITHGYHEDDYFVPGDSGTPVVAVGAAGVGFPTCWDQWFPELARAYALRHADVLVYPTAIGSEPGHPAFDTAPLWRQVIVGNGIANGLFMVAINRVGTEQVTPEAPAITFYGSSFVSDPYGRVLAEAPRDEPAVLVVDLDLDARRDWLELFPFLATRRPSAYGALVEPLGDP